MDEPTPAAALPRTVIQQDRRTVLQAGAALALGALAGGLRGAAPPAPAADNP